MVFADGPGDDDEYSPFDNPRDRLSTYRIAVEDLHLQNPQMSGIVDLWLECSYEEQGERKALLQYRAVQDLAATAQEEDVDRVLLDNLDTIATYLSTVEEEHRGREPETEEEEQYQILLPVIAETRQACEDAVYEEVDHDADIDYSDLQDVVDQ